MSELCRWVVQVACKNWMSLSGGTPEPDFMNIPQDVFINICEWLSIRDILALRMTNKCIAQTTRHSIIWSSMLRRLMIPLPILPATSRYHFGEILPSTYERLMRRALYLEHNWRRQTPLGAHCRFQAFGRTLIIKMLPGGKYMFSVTKNLDAEKYSLILWDMDNRGGRVALSAANSSTPFLKLEVKYALVHNTMCIVLAYAKPPKKTQDRDLSLVRVLAVPIDVLEELAAHPKDSNKFKCFAEVLPFPFQILHESTTKCDIGQLALGRVHDEPVLLVVHRPRALAFHYLESGRRGNLLLGPIQPFGTLRHAIWAVKFLPAQNSVLVCRVLMENGVDTDGTLYSLEMFLLPGPGSSYKSPTALGRQVISGLRIDGFYFSDLETSWFNSLHDPEGLLPAPANLEPPPISIFMTTKEPRGFVHCIMRPKPVPNEVVILPNGRGLLYRYAYGLPAMKLERHQWEDEYARAIIVPGAYRSIIYMRPHIRPEFQKEGIVSPGGTEVLRFCTYGTRAEEHHKFATPRTTGHYSTEVAPDGNAMEIDEESCPSAELEGDIEERECSMRIPEIPSVIAWNMMHGTTALAFDESIGKLCIATTEDTEIHMLDFGGENWEVPVIQL